jgi:hypothetical protein
MYNIKNWLRTNEKEELPQIKLNDLQYDQSQVTTSKTTPTSHSPPPTKKEKRKKEKRQNNLKV